MSELTQCNFCTLKVLRARARKESKTITIKPRDGGMGVWVHSKNVHPVMVIRTDPDLWFMELSDHCVC